MMLFLFSGLKWDIQRGGLVKNITERFRRIWSIRRTQFLAVAVFLFVVGAYLSLAAALGPVDGDGLIPTDLERIKVGDVAPDFTLEAEKGTPITLSQFREKNSVILVFYRGHW
jgi:cytochrome oxidase Cu insertion factor (SCO1/SenC/PrrC family)